MTEWRGHNDTSVNLTVTINGTDYSANQGPGFVESTFIDSDNPQGKYWSGQLTLTNDIARVVSSSLVAAIDLDPTTNTDFERGNLVVIVANGNTWNFRVEAVNITRWTAAIVPSEIEIELTDKLGLVNREFPANPVFTQSVSREFLRADDSTISRGYSTWLDSIRDELIAPRETNGAAILTAADFDLSAPTTLLATGLPDGYSNSQNREKNPYVNAAGIASARGYTLYCDPTDEKIRVTQYPLTSADGTLAWRWALDQMLTFTPAIEPLDESVDAVEVVNQSTGPIEEDEKISYPNIIPLAVAYPPGSTDDPIVVCERTEQRPSESSTTFSQTYQIRARSFWLFEYDVVTISPTVTEIRPNTSQDWVLVATGQISRTFNQDGIATRDDDAQSIIGGVVLENGIPKSVLPPLADYYGDTTLRGGQGTFETTRVGADGVPRSRRKERRGILGSTTAFGDAFGLSLASAIVARVLEIEEETTTPRGDKKYIQIIGHTQVSFTIESNGNLSIAYTTGDREPTFRVIDGVPRGSNAKNPEGPIEIKENRSTQSVDSPLGRGRKRSRIMSWGTSAQHAIAAAKMAIALKQQGALSFDAERVLQPGESMVPFRVEHVGDRALVRDAERISWEPNEMKYTYTGRQIGVLADAVEAPIRVVVIPGGGLVAGPMPDLT